MSRNDLIAAEDEIKINESKLVKGRIDYEAGKPSTARFPVSATLIFPQAE